jgi:hypothetical protein
MDSEINEAPKLAICSVPSHRADGSRDDQCSAESLVEGVIAFFGHYGQPRGWDCSDAGSRGSTAAQTAGSTRVPSAHMISVTFTRSLIGSHPQSNPGSHNDRLMAT